ncbi:MAG: hypothetical protein JSU74_08950 [Candidatus Zixiibacteriota bacterium]|nr:MAG: hypothetical protein JSU74_08950 [candidate division Zixibacteria bacterium]
MSSVLFVAYLVIVLVALQTGERRYHSLGRELVQWDGQLYLSIARDGYESFPPTTTQPYITGNVGWFPFYPLLGRALSYTGLTTPWSLIVLSWICLWLALIVIYSLVESKFGERTAIFTVLAAFLYPTSFYFVAAFPYSLYLLLAVVTFYLLHRQKYALLWLPTAGLAVTYPSGMVIALPIAYHLIRHWKALRRSQRVWLAVAILAIGVAILAYFFHYYVKFGDFFLYFHYQSQYLHGHSLTFPLVTLYKFMTELSFTHLEFLIVALTLGFAVLTYTRKMDGEWQVYLLAVLLFTPTFGTIQCYYRHVLVAFPLFVMLGMAAGSPRRKYLFGGYVVASALLAWFVFVPAFKKAVLM